MAVTRTLAVLIALAACTSGRSTGDASSGDAENITIPDAAPPPFDAAALPNMKCQPNTQCGLPPSQCLDANYLIYYTGGACVDRQCEFEEHWLYCYGGCWKNVDPITGDGCSPSFT
jgi:hypothetical protein